VTAFDGLNPQQETSEMDHREITTAKQAAAARKRIEAEHERLQAEHEQILDQSTESRLEKNRQARMKALADLQELSRAEALLASKAGEPPEVPELRERNKALMALQRSLLFDGSGDRGVMPSKYIRADALEHFGQLVEDARRRKAELLARFEGHQHDVRMGPRSSAELKECDAIIAEWPKTERLCRCGSELHEIRRELQANSEKIAALMEQQRRKALAVA